MVCCAPRVSVARAMARTNALLLPRAAQTLPPSCAGAKKNSTDFVQNQWSFDFLSTSFERKWPMCSTHSPRGERELAKHRVERGIATHKRRRKCSALSVCCPLFLRERFICSLPSNATRRRFADNRPFREHKQTAVFRRRRFVSSSMGRRVVHSCLFSFRWSFLPVAGGCFLSCVPFRTDH